MNNRPPFIISVGNLAMGGTGKTPFAIFLAELFMSESRKTAILSRGYKGALGLDTHVISDGQTLFHHPPAAADEPYMMALAVPGIVVITGKDRTASLELAMKNYASEIFILDDGFQHRKLRRDINIVLLDHRRPLSTGFPFPFGYLREFPSALSRADIIIFTRATDTELPAKMSKYCKGKSVYFSEFVYSRFVYNGKELPAEDLRGKHIWLMSGIAHNDKFNEQMLSYSAKICGHSRFKDHHKYTIDTLESVINAADKAGVELIITTQKDFVKIPTSYQAHFAYPVVSVNMLNQGFVEEIKFRVAGINSPNRGAMLA